MGEWTGGKNHYLLCTRNEKVRQQIDEEYEKELEKEILNLLIGQQPSIDSLQEKPEESIPEKYPEPSSEPL